MIAAASLLASALMTIGAAAPAATTSNLMPSFPDTSDRRLILNWLVQSAGFPAGAPVDLGPESAVLIETDSTDGLVRGLHAVRFREEAIAAEFVGRNGGRSVSGTATIDCNEGLVRAGAMTVFHGTGLKGERVSTFPAQATWRAPPPDSLFQRVVESTCDAETVADAAAAPTPAPTASAGPAPPPPSVASGNVTVQVGAFATREQATAALAKATALAGAQVAGHKTEIASARLNTAQVFRALIHGFGTRSEAQAFCARMQAQGQPCLVRPS